MGKTIFGDEWAKLIAPVLPTLYEEGQGTPEVCRTLAISKTSYYELLGTCAEFKAAHDEGLYRSEAWWMEYGRLGMQKKNPLLIAPWIFTMKARFGWIDRQVISTETAHPEENEAPTLSPKEAAQLLEGGNLRQVNT